LTASKVVSSPSPTASRAGSNQIKTQQGSENPYGGAQARPFRTHRVEQVRGRVIKENFWKTWIPQWGSERPLITKAERLKRLRREGHARHRTVRFGVRTKKPTRYQGVSDQAPNKAGKYPKPVKSRRMLKRPGRPKSLYSEGERGLFRKKGKRGDGGEGPLLP